MLPDDFDKLKDYLSKQNKFVSSDEGKHPSGLIKKLKGIGLVDFYPDVYKLRKMNEGIFNPCIDFFVNYFIPSGRTVEEQSLVIKQIGKSSSEILKRQGVTEFREFMNNEILKNSSREPTDYIFLGPQFSSLRNKTKVFQGLLIHQMIFSH